MIEYLAQWLGIFVACLYAVIAELRWFNRDIFPEWWNPFKW